MVVYERSTVVRAPFEAVWEFHASVDGLEALTPGWLGMEVVDLRGPDGAPDPDELEAGSEVDLALRPLGVGSGRTWTSRIVERERDAAAGHFVDEMLDGPFARWRHTHRFAAVDGGTRVTDHVEYALPPGRARPLTVLAWPGLEAMFSGRHRRTRRLLE